VSGKRTPAEVLADSRRRDSRLKRAKVLETVEAMVSSDQPVTFAGVAKTAGVSNWLVYADGVREHIQSARDKQATRVQRGRSAGTAASADGLKTDLELARQEIASLRTERDKFKGALQRQLGQQLDQVAAGDLIVRINELTQQNERLVAERDNLERQNAALEAKLAETEDDLGAARASLRRVIRAENT
jgi:chromosome segregation ATPase